jgi:hypothetical protein
MFPEAAAVRRKKLCTEDPFGAVDRPAFDGKRANQWPTDSQKRASPPLAAPVPTRFARSSPTAFGAVR